MGSIISYLKKKWRQWSALICSSLGVVGGIFLMILPGGQLLGSTLISGGVSGIVNTLKYLKKKEEFDFQDFLIDLGFGFITGGLTFGFSSLGSAVAAKAALNLVKSKIVQTTVSSIVQTSVSSIGTGLAYAGASAGKKCVKGQKIQGMQLLKDGLKGGLSQLAGQLVGIFSNFVASKLAQKASQPASKFFSKFGPGTVGGGISNALQSIITRILETKVLQLEDFIQFMTQAAQITQGYAKKIYQMLKEFKVISDTGKLLKNIDIKSLKLQKKSQEALKKLFKKLKKFNIFKDATIGAVFGGVGGLISGADLVKKSKKTNSTQLNDKKLTQKDSLETSMKGIKYQKEIGQKLNVMKQPKYNFELSSKLDIKKEELQIFQKINQSRASCNKKLLDKILKPYSKKDSSQIKNIKSHFESPQSKKGISKSDNMACKQPQKTRNKTKKFQKINKIVNACESAYNLHKHQANFKQLKKQGGEFVQKTWKKMKNCIY